jgi:hypothetical protein
MKAWASPPKNSSFGTLSIVVIATVWLVLTLSVFGFHGVDLWCQSLIHLLCIGAGLTFLWLGGVEWTLLKRHSRSLLLWMVLLIFLCVSCTQSGAPARSEQELWNWLDYFWIFFFSLYLSRNAKEILRSFLFLSWSVWLVWGICELWHLKGSSTTGQFNASALGSYLLIPLFLGLERCAKVHNRLSFYVFSAAAALVLLASKSVAVWLALAGGFVYLCLGAGAISPQRKKYVWSLSCVALTVATWKMSQHWDWHRWLWWKAALQMAQLHPVLGNGLGTFELGLPHWAELNLFTFYAHNTFLQWASDIGLTGVIIVSLLIVVSLRALGNPFAIAGGVSLLIHNLFDYSLLLPSHAFLFWGLLGGLFSADVQGAPARQRFEPATTSKPCQYLCAWAPRIPLTLLLVGLAVVYVRRFAANQDYAHAEAEWTSGQLAASRTDAMASLRKYSGDPLPFTLLARISAYESLRTHSRADLDQTLAYTLEALQREPIQPIHWIHAMELQGMLNYRKTREQLKNTLLSRYPYLKLDKRLQPFL